MNTDSVEQTAFDAGGGSVNLVEQVTNLLTQQGHSRPDAWMASLDPNALVADNPQMQRFLINRCFRQLLTKAPVNTMDVRYCLVDQGEIKDWLRLMEREVLPCVVMHDLPLIPN